MFSTPEGEMKNIQAGFMSQNFLLFDVLFLVLEPCKNEDGFLKYLEQAFQLANTYSYQSLSQTLGEE